MSQASIERRYDPPTSSPPAVPQAESPTGPPDVVPSHHVYAEVNTLTKDKEGVEGKTKEDKMKHVKEKEGECMYHVLEDPTTVQVGRVYQHNLILMCYSSSSLGFCVYATDH